MLLFAALVPGAMILLPTAFAQDQTITTPMNGSSSALPIGNMTALSGTLSMGNNTTDSPIEISEKPIATGHYNTTSQSFSNNSMQISFAGNTSFTLPNSTGTINAPTSGNVTIYFTPNGGILNGHGQLTSQDGTENATFVVTELFVRENEPGRGIVSFATNSTGQLAPLDGKIALTWDVDQPDGSTILSFYDWKSGPCTCNSAGNSTMTSSANQTMVQNNNTLTMPPTQLPSFPPSALG
jgi:hypothetical protein